MPRNTAFKYRSAADWCRTRSPASREPEVWSDFSRQWETLAAIAETLSAKPVEPATAALAVEPGPASCENPRRTLLLAGVFCARRDPSFKCDPLTCALSQSPESSRR